MTRTNKKGMWLGQGAENGEKQPWLITTVSALLGSGMLLLTVSALSGFGEISSAAPLLLSALAVCLLYGMLRMKKKGGFYPVMLLAEFAMVLLLGINIIGGFSTFWNQLVDTWTSRTGWVLPELEQAGDVLLFALFLGSVCGVLCCFLAEKARALLPLIPAALLLWGMVVFRQTAELEALLPLLIGAVVLLLLSGWSRRKTEGSFWIGFGVLLLLIGAGAALSLNPAVQAKSEEASRTFLKNYHEEKYETDYSTLPEGDFSDYRNDGKGEHPALVVTAKYPETLYLRGFTGGIFENNTWKETPTEQLAESKELLYWLNLQEFNPAAQFAAAENGEEKNNITVQNIGACSQYLYVPFSLSGGEYLNAENLFTDSVKTDGQRTYHFTSAAKAADKIQTVLEQLQSRQDEETLSYRRAESAYRDYVKENYLQIPQDVLIMLEEHWNKAAGGQNPKEMDWESVQIAALEFLQDCFPEDGEKSEISLPLSVAAGTDYQYATVAVMTLRYFGIPARYAEGYLVTEEQFEAADGSCSARVNSQSAAAWAEVYQDGIGWLPMNLTEGMSELQESFSKEHSSQSGGGISDVKEGEELEEESDAPTEEPVPDGGYVTRIETAVKWTAWLLLLLLLLLILALILRRKLILKRKAERFAAENSNDAAAWIYGDAAVLLEELGFRRGNGSMYELYQPICERFGEEYGRRFMAVTECNSRAMFSSGKIPEEKRQEALNFRTETIEKLAEHTKRTRRIWLKWFRCLY